MKRLVAAVLAASVASTAAKAAEAEQKPEVVLLYNLLHLDKTAVDPGLGDPLAEMHAVQNAYVALRDNAASDTTPDRHFLKLFLFAGWAARQTNAFDTIEAFNTDLNPIFDKQPGAVLDVVKTSDFLLENTCTTLARHFFFEDAQPIDRYDFMRRHEGAMREVLGEDGAASCAAAFWSVQK